MVESSRCVGAWVRVCVCVRGCVGACVSVRLKGQAKVRRGWAELSAVFNGQFVLEFSSASHSPSTFTIILRFFILIHHPLGLWPTETQACDCSDLRWLTLGQQDNGKHSNPFSYLPNCALIKVCGAREQSGTIVIV